MHRKAVLIDPHAQSITDIVIELPDDRHASERVLNDVLHQLIDCEMLEATYFDLPGHPTSLVLSDEEGLMVDEPAYFTLYNHPIPGRGVLVCEDGMGNVCDATFTAADIQRIVNFVSARFAQAARDLAHQQQIQDLRDKGFVVQPFEDGAGYMVISPPQAGEPPTS